MKVLKFGGTSLGDASQMKKVAAIVSHENDCVVVCSAMAGVTNTLVDMARLWNLGNTDRIMVLLQELHMRFDKTCYELFPDFSEASGFLDMIAEHIYQVEKRLLEPYSLSSEYWLLSQGEVITSRLFTEYLNAKGGGFELIDAFGFMRLQEDGEPSVASVQRHLFGLHGQLQQGRYVTQGFICLDHHGHPSNLKRGGSDYTATLIGAAIQASVIEIWTDIDGVRNNDPRFVSNTFPVREISFAEAAELAYFGAKILHPACVWPASSQNIPIYLKSTMEPAAPGTVIRQQAESDGIRAVAAKSGISIVRIKSARMLNAYGFLRRVFEIFETYSTPIDVITTSEVAVSVTIDDPANIEPICRELKLLGDVSVEAEQAIICIVGDILAEHQGYAAQILDALKHIHVKMVSFGGSRNNLTLVVPEREKHESLVALQRRLFSKEDQKGVTFSNQTYFAN